MPVTGIRLRITASAGDAIHLKELRENLINFSCVECKVFFCHPEW